MLGWFKRRRMNRRIIEEVADFNGPVRIVKHCQNASSVTINRSSVVIGELNFIITYKVETDGNLINQRFQVILSPLDKSLSRCIGTSDVITIKSVYDWSHDVVQFTPNIRFFILNLFERLRSYKTTDVEDFEKLKSDIRTQIANLMSAF